MLEGGTGNNYFDPYSQNNLRKIVLAVLVFFCIVIGGSFYLYFRLFNNEKESQTSLNTKTAAVPTNNLPAVYPDASGNNTISGDASSKVKAENLLFSDFYESHGDAKNYHAFNFKLPINVKSDVSNYYELSRKINMDQQVDLLNKYGFAFVDNSFQKEADNFFNLYSLMNKKNIPILITSDFLIYNFQNVLKGVYKEIESEIFYKELWKINKALFEVSDAEYKKKKNIIGLGNDPTVEGLRKKAAFFAVMLELLKPKTEQINKAASFDNAKFTVADSLNFDFKMPEYLFDDVKQEVAYIIESKQETKSPIFLYLKDYKKYKIPEEYQTNAKLNNYYLASVWQDSLFPLFYRNGDCPDCLLDKYDWKVNMMAACSITKSFSENQDIKNSWAKIYKVMSFFNGLRGEVTYLNYQKALIDNFGQEYKLENIFSNKNINQESDLEKLQSTINATQFSELEGGYSRTDNSNKKYIGLRVLQEPYWPDRYIFDQLLFLKAGEYTQNIRYLSKINITGCQDKSSFVRCGNIGLDIINIIYPIATGNQYFFENTKYSDYYRQVELLNNKLLEFDKYSWHNNIYWANLDMGKKLLYSYKTSDKKYPYWENNDWQDKSIQTVLGSWVNLQLPLDKIVNNPSNVGKLTETTIGDDDYVEPNSDLIDDIISNADMVKKILMKLEVIKENDFINKELSRLINDNERMKSISEKEIKGEPLSLEDKKSIADMAKIFYSESNSQKSVKLMHIKENISGVKMMPYIYKNPDKRLVMAIGAVFNYKETRQ